MPSEAASKHGPVAPLEAVPDNPHSLPAESALEALGARVAAGLDETEVRRRAERFGPNTIAARQKVSALAVLLHQFQSPVVYLLAAAAALALYFREWEEGVAIGAVLAINALIGFMTEIRAARSIEALRALGTHSARVRRDGHIRMIPAEELVPGDIVLVEGGDSVSADLRLVEVSNLAADKSTLTGESVASDKGTAPVAAEAGIGDRSAMLFKGTTLTRGSGTGVVVATGQATELGRISHLVEETEPEATPLERRLARLSLQLVWAVLILTVVIAGVGLTTGKDAFLMVEAAIALAVAAIPEGLPIVATLALARGMWRMARRNALVERLSAVETLGATTVILTDKTGTLTENRMAVNRVWTPSGEVEFDARSAGAEFRGDDDPQLRRLLEVAALCNNAALERPEDSGSGDPMEIALLRAASREGLSQSALLAESPLVAMHAFDTDRKMMATVHARSDRFLVAVKGAPEAVLDAAEAVLDDGKVAALDAEQRAEWRERVEQFGRSGLRVLGCAMKGAENPDAPPYEDLTFLGLIGLQDPARADVPQAIADCHAAGIRVVMVTGDHAVTARSIGRAVGLGDSAAIVIEGGELAALAAAKDGALFSAGIFARVSPAEKLDLVRAYQAAGDIVAMTGDGVNDAPALRQADIGVAMGLRGTDVAREAAAMILLDDAFPTIVNAVREGRVIFGNIRRLVAFLLSCNLSEVLVVGLAILSTLPLPILPLQILYLNLVTDVFPAFALAMGEGERDVLKHPPRDPKEPILSRRHWITIAAQSLALTAGTFGALALARLGLGLDGSSVVTVTFLTLALAQLWHVFNMKNRRSGVVLNEITRNPWIWASFALCAALLAVPPYVPPLARVLGLVPPSAAMWTVILAMSLAPLVLIQAVTLLLPGRRSA